MSGWRSAFGSVAARVVKAAARFDRARVRRLSELELRVLEPIYGATVELAAIELREGVRGPVNASRRAFVIENSIFLPAEYLPLRTHVLVHEVCHVWQFQNFGYHYIGDSVHAQLLGDGYELEKGLLQGLRWAELNVEQQATLVEASWLQGCFEGKPFVVRGNDWTPVWREAVASLGSRIRLDRAP
ncbi:MAG: hypothetical protein ACOZQL_12360 [Myxococcota bacterium]